MGSNKLAVQPQQPGVYRDDPSDDERAETASMASAVLLGDIESFPDDELPAYTDVPAELSTSRRVLPPVTEQSCYVPPPDLPFSSHDINQSETRTRFPNYSTDSKTLLAMLREQALYAPTYVVCLSGTHKETSRQGNKETKTTVKDFFVRVNLTNLLSPAPLAGGRIELLPHDVRGYRGSIIPKLKPTVGTGDPEDQTDELEAWCEHYVQNPAGVKSFTLERRITNHDTKKLEQLLRSAIYDTNYKGHLNIQFHKQHKKVIVYSPGKINEWRITTWIRWVFYLTFLWIFAWPILFFLTHKYEVIKVIYQYADVPSNYGGDRRCTVMSELEWFNRWESAIKRAALARMLCEERCIDDDYRIATAQADARGVALSQQPRERPQTGNAFADGALNFVSAGLGIAQEYNASRGWGADC